METILKTSRNLDNKRKKTTDTEDEEKRYRSTFDKSQIGEMERVFLENHYPDVAGRSDLSQRTGLSEQQVQIWFQTEELNGGNNSASSVPWRVPSIFGIGCPSDLRNFQPYNHSFSEHFNTEDRTCGRQHVAALQPVTFPSIASPPVSSPTTSSIPPVSSPTTSSIPQSTNTTESDFTQVKRQAGNLEIRKESSLLSLRLKAKKHIASLRL
ncbi:paired mesoderm homeobox protein 2-like [Acropora millepora]|uniref:paired mesoderm homeobox protein 2-like n=1 Tax=Acropora millepora TaxID=45264 RepID=UPI001CF403A7|nr:paired mesoderm homeobox protein 2-like [Acropora millepora]